MGRPGLTAHRKFRRLSLVLGGDAIARGTLELIWDVAYQSGDDYLGDAMDVALAARWPGEPSTLVKALSEAGGGDNAGFIEQDDERGGWRVHNLYENAPVYVQKRLEREVERRKKGVTISDLRRVAGRAGKQASDFRLPVNHKPVADVCQATDSSYRANGHTPSPPLPVASSDTPTESPQTQPEVAPKANGKRSRKAKPEEPVLFPGVSPEEALQALSEGSRGRFVATTPKGKNAATLKAAVKANPDKAIWTRTGEWIAAGGEWRPVIDSRNLLGCLDEWLAHAKVWKGEPIGKSQNGNGGSPSPASSMNQDSADEIGRVF